MFIDVPEADFAELIKACCASAGEQPFAAFRSAWQPYLEAALALVDVEWSAVDALHESIYAEYRAVLREPFRPALDYETYLLAIGFARLAKDRGEHALRALLTEIAATPGALMTPHQVNIVIFCAILRVPGGCISPLLRLYCPPREPVWTTVRAMFYAQVTPPAPAQCVEPLKRALMRLLC